MRLSFAAARHVVAALALAFVAYAVVAQDAGSPAQLAAWQSQKSALEAQQQAAAGQRAALQNQLAAIQAELARLQAALDSPFDVVQNPIGAAGVAGGKAVIQGANPMDNRSLQDRAMDNAWVAIQQRNATRDARDQKRAELARVQADAARLDAEAAARADQIAQLDRAIAYYRNPRQGDLDNERARLRNLEGQKATADDGGQLGWDIDNTRRRIQELEQAFQQGGGSSTGGSPGQSQGAYGASTGSPSTGTPSQFPFPGYGGGFIGTPAAYGSPVMPRWTDLTPPPSSRHSSGSTSSPGPAAGSSSGGAPPTGATCGPGTSCSCASGGTGHIPCDASMGACHCGGG